MVYIFCRLVFDEDVDSLHGVVLSASEVNIIIYEDYTFPVYREAGKYTRYCNDIESNKGGFKRKLIS